LREFKSFFETIKQLKAKPAVVTIHGFKDKAAAQQEVRKGVDLYRQKFST
jgi:inorganic pyrophosphatase